MGKAYRHRLAHPRSEGVRLPQLGLSGVRFPAVRNGREQQVHVEDCTRQVFWCGVARPAQALSRPAPETPGSADSRHTALAWARSTGVGRIATILSDHVEILRVLEITRRPLRQILGDRLGRHDVPCRQECKEEVYPAVCTFRAAAALYGIVSPRDFGRARAAGRSGMRKLGGAPMAGTPEISLMNFMVGQLAHRYRLPWTRPCASTSPSARRSCRRGWSRAWRRRFPRRLPPAPEAASWRGCAPGALRLW